MADIALEKARSLVAFRDMMQKMRVAVNNRMDARVRLQMVEGDGAGEDEPVEISLDDLDDLGLEDLGFYSWLKEWSGRFSEIEEKIDHEIAEIIDGSPILSAMKSVKGVGPVLAARVAARIDIRKANTVSALWRYAGYAVDEEGNAERRRKGQKLTYNKALKVSCYLLGISLLRANSPYRSIYDQSVEYYMQNRPEWTKMHRHMASMRRMVKMFLSHMWQVWRELEGLPVNKPYVQDILGHADIIQPQSFGWPGRNGQE